jgi:hypothetical protein
MRKHLLSELPTSRRRVAALDFLLALLVFFSVPTAAQTSYSGSFQEPATGWNALPHLSHDSLAARAGVGHRFPVGSAEQQAGFSRDPRLLRTYVPSSNR